jgi:hypothetical protein
MQVRGGRLGGGEANRVPMHRPRTARRLAIDRSRIRAAAPGIRLHGLRRIRLRIRLSRSLHATGCDCMRQAEGDCQRQGMRSRRARSRVGSGACGVGRIPPRSYGAEREGFEPSVQLPVHRFSRPARSAALAPLRIRYSLTWRTLGNQIRAIKEPYPFQPRGILPCRGSQRFARRRSAAPNTGSRWPAAKTTPSATSSKPPSKHAGSSLTTSKV